MGTGKTSVGKRLARLLGLEFRDLDDLIEAEAGMTVKDIFSEFGEGYFRAVERKTVKDLTDGAFGSGLVVSSGGGTVADVGSRALLRGWAAVICLEASVDEILKRVGAGAGRPLLMGKEKRRGVEKLLKERAAAYDDCDLKVDTTSKTIDEVVRVIEAFLKKKGLVGK